MESTYLKIRDFCPILGTTRVYFPGVVLFYKSAHKDGIYPTSQGIRLPLGYFFAHLVKYVTQFYYWASFPLVIVGAAFAKKEGQMVYSPHPRQQPSRLPTPEASEGKGMLASTFPSEQGCMAVVCQYSISAPTYFLGVYE